MAVDGLLVATHDQCWLHDPGPGHPENRFRLDAVKRGLTEAGLDEAIGWVEAPVADRAAIDSVHDPHLYDRLDQLAKAGGGAIDPDTTVNAHSASAAKRAAGAGLELIRRLEAGEAAAGWSVVRPPGHHATPDRQMGFCLFNNIAVAARSLTKRGERVMIVDVDAHHGNGTQEVFYEDPDVLFVSFHQFPWYPFTGRPDEIGEGAGRGTTVNIPMPAGATGDNYRLAFNQVVVPVAERFAPTWVLVSAGFDGHRDDPLTTLGLTSVDYADLIDAVIDLVPPGRRLLFLEGGYNYEALANTAGSVVAKMLGVHYRPEKPTSGGPGAEHVELVRSIQFERDW
ncbi:MAG: histone deacetylase [Acidimicrobiia bacterium]|nr:histone deacetylase [Acidimicrobiia bacterium]